MTDYRLAPLAWLLVFVAGLRPARAQAATHGPYDGRFIHDGVGLKKPLAAEPAPLRAVELKGWNLRPTSVPVGGGRREK